MKSQILTAALHLMEQNGATTNLEVKNYLHDETSDPSFSLTQREVSDTMRVLAQENDWDFTFNGAYRTYSPKPSVAPIPSATAAGKPAWANIPRNPVVTPSNLIVRTVLATILGPDLSHCQDPSDAMVGYYRPNPALYVTGWDRNDVRRVLYTELKNGKMGPIERDDINVCAQSYYHKHIA